jgi:hypothetical protein
MFLRKRSAYQRRERFSQVMVTIQMFMHLDKRVSGFFGILI